MRGSLGARIEAANAEILDAGDCDAIPRWFAPDHVTHLTGEDLTGGHATIRRILETYRRAFPDLQVARIEILAEDEASGRVAWQRTLRATHLGAFRGFPATGRPVTWREMVVSRLVDGRIVEDWLLSDLAEQLLAARSSGRRTGGSPRARGGAR